MSQDRFPLGLGWLTAAFLLLVPVALTPDLLDRYRVIKESLARTEAIVGAVLIVIAAAFAGTERLREMLRERAVVAAAGAGVLWVALATLTSTHRVHSVDALVTFVCSILLFVVAWYAAPRVPLLALDLLVPVVLVNTALCAMQEYGIYQPFQPSSPLMPRHLTATGLIGNPNIVGSYMVLATVVFAGAAIALRGWRRWLYAFGALCAIAGVFVSETRTAVIALVAGLLLLAVGTSIRRALFLAAALVVVLLLGVALRVKVVTEVLLLPGDVAAQGLERASSGRIVPLLSALEMTRDHPLTGAGPGTFPYHYMDYKVRASDRYGIVSLVPMNFGEAHNDHAQVLAETGVPGYLLFLGGIFVLVRAVRRANEDGDARARVARGVILPLAGTLLVICLAQFPLYVPITRHFLMTMAGLLLGWSRE